MGNCAGYCEGGAEDQKKKVTVEQREGDERGVAYIDERRGEFEIEYAKKQMNQNQYDYNK